MALSSRLARSGHGVSAFARLSWVACVALGALPLAACGDDSADGSGGGSSGDTTSATTSTTATSSSTGCAGVVEDGACVTKCTPDLCAEGNTCVGNRCQLQCEGAADCYPGFSCLDAVEDDTGAAIKTCQPSGKAAILGANCYFGTECDAWTVCPDGTACGASLCGGGACSNGLCPDGVTACAPQTCDATECRSPRCLGAVEGADQSPSATSYCTQDDCTADADCAQGMYCGKTRDFHEVCGENVELGSETPCIDPADFDANGQTFELGSVSLLRNTCLVRRQCAPCASDADCSGEAGQLCATVGGESRCATTCVGDNDCEADAACLEDPAHPGQLVCTPRFGACAGEGEFCEPCLNDLDCGGPETSKICYPLSGAQRACFDLSFPDECTTDADCPTSPDGVTHGECLDGGEGYTSADPEFQRCFLPYFSVSNRFQCW